MKSFAKIFVILVFSLLVGMLVGPREAKAQGCTTNADCQNIGYPPCFVCNAPNCEPDDTVCDDGNACTSDACVQDFLGFYFGCLSLPIALDPAGLNPNLPTECYVCEPTENNVLVNNGVCDTFAGENCQANPGECGIEGFTCLGAPPNPPLNAPFGQRCATFEGPVDDMPFLTIACEDGDRCTEDFCTTSSSQPTSTPGICTSQPKVCEPIADGCCPIEPTTGQPCVGPPPGQNCPATFNDPFCDPDCWPVQDCGDGLVEPPETCDDAADAGSAGIKPNGTEVTDAECRDAGSGVGIECTYCGDNIIQTAAGEECDGSAANQCGTEGCDVTTCLCNQVQTNLCVTGSGPIWNTIRPGCGNCSLNPAATSKGLSDYAIFMALGLLLAGGLAMRRRII